MLFGRLCDDFMYCLWRDDDGPKNLLTPRWRPPSSLQFPRRCRYPIEQLGRLLVSVFLEGTETAQRGSCNNWVLENFNQCPNVTSQYPLHFSSPKTPSSATRRSPGNQRINFIRSYFGLFSKFIWFSSGFMKRIKFLMMPYGSFPDNIGYFAYCVTTTETTVQWLKKMSWTIYDDKNNIS